MFALASDPYLLAVARSLQGASAGTVFTVALSLLVAGIDRDELGGWIGLVFSGMTAGLTFAPMVGGIGLCKSWVFCCIRCGACGYRRAIRSMSVLCRP